MRIFWLLNCFQILYGALFFEYSSYWECKTFQKTFSFALSKVLKNTFRIYFFHFLIISLVKIETFLKKFWLSHQANKDGEIHSFFTRGKNKSQIKLFHKHGKLCRLGKLADTVLLEDMVKPAVPFLRPNIPWYAQIFKLVQNVIYPNGKFIFSNLFGLLNT